MTWPTMNTFEEVVLDATLVNGPIQEFKIPQFSSPINAGWHDGKLKVWYWTVGGSKDKTLRCAIVTSFYRFQDNQMGYAWAYLMTVMQETPSQPLHILYYTKEND